MKSTPMMADGKWRIENAKYDARSTVWLRENESANLLAWTQFHVLIHPGQRQAQTHQTLFIHAKARRIPAENIFILP